MPIAVNADSIRVEEPDRYSYEDKSVMQLEVRGKYGRYLRFKGRSPVFYDATPPSAPSCTRNWNSTRVNCTAGYPGSPARYRSKNWTYRLDCQDKTFDRDNEDDWEYVDEDPVAKTVANKYCPIINTLKKSGHGYLWDKKADPLYNKGINAGDDKKAIFYYTQAIEINPNYIYALNNRALTYEKIGEQELACKDWEKIYKLEPSYENIDWSSFACSFAPSSSTTIITAISLGSIILLMISFISYLFMRIGAIYIFPIVLLMLYITFLIL